MPPVTALWRTVIVALVMATLIVASLVLVLHFKGDAAIFSTTAWSLVAILGIVAGKSLGQSAAGGPGMAGIAKVLLTDAKPDPVPQAPTP